MEKKKKKRRTRVWERGRGTPEKIGSSFLQSAVAATIVACWLAECRVFRIAPNIDSRRGENAILLQAI